jgi:serine/threonine protein kinase
MSLSQRMQIAIDSATVFEYMHHLGIVHRDIKSHNVLIDNNFNVKVCDFGLAKFTVSIIKHFTKCTTFFFRLISAKAQCNMQEPQHTWLQNYSRKDSTISLLMCLLLDACSGR